MSTKWNRVIRRLMWLGSGAVMLQAAGCDTALNVIQTGLLAGIAGITFFLASNV
ncbi:MAG TPA: hypothetical protein VLM89_16455 [Phycisphaerae bacterium]|nr:hypothetical protein [Phycisphaerae bacterium]